MTAIWLGFGLLQLLAGIVIGWSLARRWCGGQAAQASQLYRLADHVRRLIHDVHGKVGEHQTQIQRINRELNADPSDQDGLAAAIFRSVSKVIQANEKLHDQLFHTEQKLERKEREIRDYIAEARTDALTSLPNRRVFDDAIAQQHALHDRQGTRFGIVHLDIDHFKQLNDRWGHPAGDEVLKRVAASIRQAARETDVVARIGGEEFAVILPDATVDALQAAAERIRRAVAETQIEIRRTRVPVTISLGAALIEAGESRQSLIGRSDAALYASKQDGRNCSHWHDGTICRRIGAGDDGPAESPGNPAQPEWQEQTSWRRVCDDLRRSFSEFVGRGS